ncbi:MAG: hypothetical protein JXB23_09595 [Candidatus Aminicenantes bacterium]|nr:hypothetical protein [Candidatus Aminicenantes bacterium]
MSCTCLQSMPDDLIGIWKTRAPEYLTTFIQIKEKSIVIGQRGGTEKTFPIKGIKKKKVNKEWARYTIYCLDDERARFEVPILFSPYNRGIIRLANKKEISWTKTRNRTKEEGE